MEFFESRRLPYVVVARLQEKIQTLLRSDLKWKPTEVSGMEVAESVYQAAGWKRARRLILIRRSQISPEIPKPCWSSLITFSQSARLL